LGNRVNQISIYAVIFISVTLLFLPVQQGYGVLTLPPELNEEQLIELYKLEQLVKAEQARDENFVSMIQKNPYADTSSNAIISFKENSEKNSLKSLDRENKNFQLIKDEQISIAEKKCKEILGGKTISNSIDNEPVNKKTALKFEIGDEVGSMKKKSDDFEKYRLLQILIAEDYRDNNWKEYWEPNPYQNNESIRGLSNNEENKILSPALDFRQSEEFKNLTIEQISLAENIRNEMLEFRITGSLNPYLNENIDESLDKTNPNNGIVADFAPSLLVVTSSYTATGITAFAPSLLVVASSYTATGITALATDPTYVTNELDFNIIDRNAKGFELIKAKEIEIAQDTLNEMLFLSNSEEDDVEIILTTNENKKLNHYERDEQGFEFFKNKQIEMAEKKLIEIFGQKNIHNSNYLDSENS